MLRKSDAALLRFNFLNLHQTTIGTECDQRRFELGVSNRPAATATVCSSDPDPTHWVLLLFKNGI